MGSTEQDRSLNSGVSLPQWMKSKIGDRYDLDETFSPPSHDDSFFYIRYPKAYSSQKPQEQAIRQTSDLLEKTEQVSKQDFSQHTLQCRQFIPEAKMDSSSSVGASDSIVKAYNKSVRAPKPAGVDDGFTGEAAACGKSVVQVAHQMIAGTMLMRGFSSNADDNVATGEGFNKNKRRGSKSLPASPLGSPQTSPQNRRKVQNRYFTGAFALEKANIHPSGGQDSANKYPGSWILSGLLGQQQRELSGSMDSITIPEEEHKKPTKPQGEPDQHSVEMRRNKSMTALVSKMLSEGSKDDDQGVEVGLDVAAATVASDSPALKSKTFRAKPSELREMNFWSPTSM
ncbi:uncharacterized protein [Periplaneta americana]|uniref:uncharacterized protein isoform X2 n=1 Tax=Periplaneta americana TaxID=6978 RepID=UPI0037E771B0